MSWQAVDPLPDVDRVVHQALLDLERVRSRSDLKRAAAVGERMRRLESAVLADVLTSIVYALSLGDPEGRTFLAGNVARRHEFGRHLIAPSERERTRWMMPFEAAGEGKPWHVRGALLGLDIGLARMMLRRTRGDLPALGPTISQADRRVLTETLVLTTAADLNEARARQVLDWLNDGRARLKSWTSEVRAELVTRLAIGERRAQAAAWTGAPRCVGASAALHADRARAAGPTGRRTGPRSSGACRARPSTAASRWPFRIRRRRSGTSGAREPASWPRASPT